MKTCDEPSDKLNRALSSLPLDPAWGPPVDALRHAAKAFGAAVEAHVPAGREQALAITKLEECLMWAVKGISHSAPKPPASQE